jgi:hypothetical protein
VHRNAQFRQAGARALLKVVGAEGGEEVAGARHPGELDGGDGPSARRLLEGIGGVDDLARCRHVVRVHELDPLDVSHHRNPHRAGFSPRARTGVSCRAVG